MKPRLLLCAACLPAILASFAQSAQADGGAKCKMSMLVQLPVVMEGRRASVQVSFNGKPSRLWLDSGAFFNVMPHALAVELDLPSAPLPVGLTVNGIGGSFTPDLVEVRDFGLAGSTLHHVQFITGGSDSGNGFLGANLLGMMDTEFDLAKGAINMFKESDCNRAGLAYWGAGMAVGEARLLHGDNANDHHIYVEVMVNDHPLRAILDTGAVTSVIGRRAAERAGIDLNAPQVVASGRIGGVGSHRRQSWIARTQTISIGGEIIRNSPIRVIDDHDDDQSHDMLLGVDFLMSHHVLVSQLLRKMFLTYNGGPIFSSTTDNEIGHLATRAENMGESEKAPDPKTADEFAGRASARLTQGDVIGSIADFTSAIALATGRADLLGDRAGAYLRGKHPELAATDIDAALAITPRDHRLLIGRAQIRLRKGDKGGALADTDAAAAATPKGSLDVLAVVHLYERLGMADRGLALIDPVVELHREDSNLAALLNARSWNRGLADADLDRALKDADTAIRRAGPVPAFLDTRALVQFRRKNYVAAIADETAALDKMPQLAGALYLRGLARLASGDAGDGDKDFAAARAVQPTIAQYYTAYGLSFPDAGATKAADRSSADTTSPAPIGSSEKDD